MFSIFRLTAACITFLIGVSFVNFSGFNRQVGEISDLETSEIQPIILADFPVDSEQTKVVFDYDRTKFHPRGSYLVLGRKPGDFREFEGFELAAFEYDNAKSSDKAFGEIDIIVRSNGVENTYYEMSGSVTNKQLIFIATPIFGEDFEYQFHGHFLRGGRISKASKNQAVI